MRPDLPPPTVAEPPRPPGRPESATTVVPGGDPSAAPPADGSRAAGGYALQREIARGGMGVVYLAHDGNLNRDVAVKVLKDDYRTAPAAVRRFVDEAHITGQLQHPGIPAVHQIGTLADGSPFLAMKLIRGQTLAALLARADRDPGSFVPAFQRIAEAVGYAHSKGVIHRDLKPANVMVGAFGEVQVMDWGLAKVLRRDDAAASTAAEATAPAGTVIRTGRAADPDADTEAGSVLGTPAYMAPEQAGGEIAEVDERADVFGLGAVLCEVLTGGAPYRGSRESIYLMAIRGELGDAFDRLDRCGADPELVGLCKRCLSPDRASRPRDAGELAAAVAGWRAAAEERARRAELDRVRAEERATTERARRRVGLALGASVLALGAVAGVGAWYGQKQARDRERAEAAWARQEEAARQEQAVRTERTHALVTALLGRLPDLYGRALWDQAAGSLAEAAELLGPDGDAELRTKVTEAEATTALLARLDAIRLGRRLGQSKLPEYVQSARQYADVFARHGFDVLGGDTDDLASRLNASPVREYLLAALDDWTTAEPDRIRRNRVFDLALRATGQHWRRGLFDAWDDGPELAARYDVLPAADVPPALTIAVALRLSALGLDGVPLLTAGLQQHPGDFWLHFGLGSVGGPDRAVERIGACRAALAVRPDSPVVYSNLGVALNASGDVEGAVRAHRQAVRLKPSYPDGYSNLAAALRAMGDLDGAARASEEAIRLDPEHFNGHHNLAGIRYKQGDYAAAARSFRDAIRLRPGFARTHIALGLALMRGGDHAGAVRAYREAIRLDPKASDAHGNLGVSLDALGDRAGAGTAFRAAVRLDPDDPYYHLNLGNLLATEGDREGAAREFSEVIRLDPAEASAHYELGRLRAEAGELGAALRSLTEAARLEPGNPTFQRYRHRVERWTAVLPRLPDIAAGRASPRDAEDALAIMDLCQQPFLRRYALAVRLAVGVFVAGPHVAEDTAAAHRYDAACGASLAVSGRAADLPAFGAEEWGYLTETARRWLRSDLAACATVAKDPGRRPEVRRRLSHWKKDPDLAAVRDPAWLDAMPDGDRNRWTQFWADVDALLTQVTPDPK